MQGIGPCLSGLESDVQPLTLHPYKNNFQIAIPFISVNHEHSNITNAAFLITALITPKIDPIKYIGIKILVAGSNTVKVNTALAEIKKEASTISQ